MSRIPAHDPFYDVLVVGSGIAGLRAAVDLAQAGATVAVVTKDAPTDSNTGFAQGGIAAALAEDDRLEFHLQDTLRAGDGLCDEAAVKILVEEGPPRIRELIEWGTQFDREGSRLSFAREGAHSVRRVLHAHGDSTGAEIVRALLSRASRYPSLTFLSRTFSVDLVMAGERCAGLLLLDEESGERRWVGAGATLLATGGAGRLYRETTNPPQATGDGVAMAYRAGAAVADLEFVQFHPTSLFARGAPRFLISEALRGEGAALRNGAGERFMARYHPEGELAPRDAVARAIVQEMERTGDRCVFLDLTGRDPRFLRERFPRIYETCERFGFDLATQRIPVHPSAHYFMGGVRTDLDGRTSLAGLYAAGEVACTGVHGANRLASNSLLEGLVFGARAAATMKSEFPLPVPASVSLPPPETRIPQRGSGLAEAIAETMWKEVGIRREAVGLGAAAEAIEAWEKGSAPLPAGRPEIEARNLLVLAGQVTRAARAREESRGAHYRADFPEKREAGRRRREYRDPQAADLPRLE